MEYSDSKVAAVKIQMQPLATTIPDANIDYTSQLRTVYVKGTQIPYIRIIFELEI